MRAAVRRQYGSVDLVHLEEIELPVLKESEVLVRVRAAGVDRGVWHLMTGKPYLMRIAGFGLRAPKNPVLGRELAGVVEAVGEGVTRFKPGDEVFGIGEGSFAEYVVAKEDLLVPKPQNLSFEQAAPIGVSGLTALQAVRDHAQVKAGQDVLVIGASGGVGTFAVQIAKVYGATVTGVCSTSKVETVKSIGADRVIDYTKDEIAGRYDVIIDTGGNTSLARLRNLLKPDGTLVIVGGEGGGDWFGIGRQLTAMLSRSKGQKLRSFICKENHEDLLVLKELIEASKLTPFVGKTFPLSAVADAIRYLEMGRAQGKVVVKVG
ncbi:MAG: NAD(P)-dependent alcohol dehydrogenase [Chloroflexi bacterium]|nr:MAG: NAD(P)-dependent alcohol dehydrogenase [Chloroflexota bacterium]